MSKLRKERAKVAYFRFFIKNDDASKYQSSVFDMTKSEIIARFKTELDAELFLEVRRLKYEKTGK